MRLVVTPGRCPVFTYFLGGTVARKVVYGAASSRATAVETRERAGIAGPAAGTAGPAAGTRGLCIRNLEVLPGPSSPAC